MSKDTGLGPVKRFGVRYGATPKHKLAEIEKEQKKPQMCPYCAKPKAYKTSFGIFECGKCGSKFTGKAYVVGKKAKLQEDVTKLTAPETEKKEEASEEE